MSYSAVDHGFSVNEPTVCIKYILTKVSFRSMYKARLCVDLLVRCDRFVITQFCISLGHSISVFRVCNGSIELP